MYHLRRTVWHLIQWMMAIGRSKASDAVPTAYASICSPSLMSVLAVEQRKGLPAVPPGKLADSVDQLKVKKLNSLIWAFMSFHELPFSCCYFGRWSPASAGQTETVHSYFHSLCSPYLSGRLIGLLTYNRSWRSFARTLNFRIWSSFECSSRDAFAIFQNLLARLNLVTHLAHKSKVWFQNSVITFPHSFQVANNLLFTWLLQLQLYN